MNIEQIELRDDLLDHILPWAQSHPIGPTDAAIEAAMACMGAAAVIIGVMPEDSREVIAEMVTDNLLAHANHRAEEMRSGAFDDQQTRIRN